MQESLSFPGKCLSVPLAAVTRRGACTVPWTWAAVLDPGLAPLCIHYVNFTQMSNFSEPQFINWKMELVSTGL